MNSVATVPIANGALHDFRAFLSLTLLSGCFVVIGCTTATLGPVSDSSSGVIVQTPTNFETALKQNLAALAERRGPQDLALYNIGVILAHPSNPKRDQIKAINSFKLLVSDYPRSTYVEQSRVWIDVLEQQQKLKEDRQKLAEEKRSLLREKEILAQERQKLHYANEKSQQLDMEIEKRRRQSLSR
jgi:hypothetical protein